MKNYTLDNINTKVRSIIEGEIHNLNKEEVYKKILELIDLTTLEATDNDSKVLDLCRKAYSLSNLNIGINCVAAVCVYPVFVATAKKALSEKNIKIAAVAGGFPSGQMPLHLRLDEVRYAVEQGADEIDMVISRGKFLTGDYDFIYEEIEKHKNACCKAHLKVILETGELETPENIKKASEIAIEAGADFIKTSTGKISPAATLEASYVMLNVIKDYYEKTGKKTGFKPAGGISTPEVALEYYILVKYILGNEWLQPNLFRFGASRLFDAILSKLIPNHF